MKAYFVDPEKRIVRAVELPDNDTAALAEMRKLIGCDDMEHCIISDEHDSIWIDELSLARGRVWAWKLRGMQDPLGGRGIIVGADDEGAPRAPVVPLQWIIRDVEWLDEIIPEITTVAEPWGARLVVTYKRVS